MTRKEWDSVFQKNAFFVNERTVIITLVIVPGVGRKTVWVGFFSSSGMLYAKHKNKHDLSEDRSFA